LLFVVGVGGGGGGGDKHILSVPVQQHV